MASDNFYSCRNCRNFHKCRSKDNPVEPTDRACNEIDFEPRNAVKRAIYPNEEAQELESSVILFIRPISDKKCEWWCDYSLTKRHVAKKKVSRDFWKSTPILRRMSRTIAQAGLEANSKVIELQLQDLAIDIDEKGLLEGVGNKEQRQQRKQKQQTTIRTLHTLRPGGGVISALNLVYEPLGGYRYLCNIDGEKKIVVAHFDKESNNYYLEIGGNSLPFDGKPIRKKLFDVPRETKIQAYINEEYQPRDAATIYRLMAKYYRLLYDVENDLFIKIAAIGPWQSWLLPVLNAVFYIGFTAKWGGGKTAFLEGITQLSRHGKLTGNISSSSIARLTERYQLSLGADEIDTKTKAKDNDTYLLYRMGYKRGNNYIRLAGDAEGGYEPDVFDPFGFKACTFHDDVEEAFKSRTFTIPLRSSSDSSLPILNLYKEKMGRPLFEELFFWYMDNIVAVVASAENTLNDTAGNILNRLENGDVSAVSANNAGGVRVLRENIKNELLDGFTDKQKTLLEKFMGRVEELLYIAFQVCNVIDIDLYEELETAFELKAQEHEEHSENYLIQQLQQLLIKQYFEHKDNEKFILDRGQFKGCVYLKKTKVYEDYRDWLYGKNIRAPDTSDFNGFLKELGFDDGINIKKERFGDDKHPKKALIFDSIALRSLGLEEEAGEGQQTFDEEEK